MRPVILILSVPKPSDDRSGHERFVAALAGVPADRKPTVPEVLPAVWAYRDKPGNGVGGSLHIVLEDDNVESRSVQWCRQYAEEQGDSDGVALADVLLRMSITQRLKLAERFYEGIY